MRERERARARQAASGTRMPYYRIGAVRKRSCFNLNYLRVLLQLQLAAGGLTVAVAALVVAGVVEAGDGAALERHTVGAARRGVGVGEGLCWRAVRERERQSRSRERERERAVRGP